MRSCSRLNRDVSEVPKEAQKGELTAHVGVLVACDVEVLLQRASETVIKSMAESRLLAFQRRLSRGQSTVFADEDVGLTSICQICLINIFHPLTDNGQCELLEANAQINETWSHPA